MDVRSEGDLASSQLFESDHGNHTYQATHAGANIEDTPEPSEVGTLLILMGIRQHNGALGRPQNTGANTEQSTGEDVETTNFGSTVFGHEQADGVDTVANTAKGHGELDANSVDDGTGEETDDGKGTVERDILSMVG